MPKLVKHMSRKAGLAPGSLIHVGEKKAENVKITIREYRDGYFQERVPHGHDGCFLQDDASIVTWINVDGLHGVVDLEELGKCFGLHPLILEDILNTNQRPKAENLDDYLCIILKMLFFMEPGKDQIEVDQVSLILGPNFIISIQERETEIFRPIVERLRLGKGRIRRLGADYLACALMDAIVDNYFVILEKLGERIELLEEKLIDSPNPNVLNGIHHLRREMLVLRKSIWPLRDVVSALQREESPLIRESSIIYFRDVYDHMVQVIETVDIFRDVLTEMVDVYLSSNSNRLNSVMKVLTIIATIFMPLSFIAGIYGMNFRYMPELEWRWGYPAVLLLMLATGFCMLIYFRRKRWL